jgi:tetratricopeptide (TPR) repeat protein
MRSVRNTVCSALALALWLAAGEPQAQPVAAGAGAAAVDGAQDRASLRRARDALLGVGDYNAAITPARTLIAAQNADPDANYPKDLAVLARLEAELRDFTTAESDFLKAIDLVVKAEGEFSLSLVDVYRGLGRAYIRAARYPEAITTLETARNVSQRNLGLFNVEQSPLIDEITTAYLGLGDTIEARRMQQERLDNAIKRFGADDPRVFPYRYQLADYYERSRLPGSARSQYEEVLKTQTAKAGPDDPALLSPLRELVKLDLLTDPGVDSDAHRRLAAVIESQPNIDPVERGLSLATLGDWATVNGDVDAARNFYRQSWEALSAKPDFKVTETFEKPTVLDFVAPLNAVDRGQRARAYQWGQVVFRFDVSADGRPLNIEVVGPPPPEPLAGRYLRRVRETHFRPRIVGGEAVATSGVQFTSYYRFYVDDKGRRRGDDDKADKDDKDQPG